MDKIHANITLSRQGTSTLFKIGIPAELLEESKESMASELLFRRYSFANEHVNRFIKDTVIPILVRDNVKNLTRKVRMIDVPEYTPVDDVDSLKVRYRPDILCTIQKSKEETIRQAVGRLIKLRDRGYISDLQLVANLMEVV